MLLKGKKVAYLGVLLALNQIALIGTAIIPTATISMFAIASMMIAIVIIEFGLKSGALFYVASSVLGFFLVPNKLEIPLYIAFFGLYSVVKYIIEDKTYSMKSKNIINIVLKLVFAGVSAITLYFLLRTLMTIELFWWMPLSGIVVFFVYDYAFTIFINYYQSTIKPKLKR